MDKYNLPLQGYERSNFTEDSDGKEKSVRWVRVDNTEAIPVTYYDESTINARHDELIAMIKQMNDNIEKINVYLALGMNHKI